MMFFIFLAFYTGMDASSVLGQVDFSSTFSSTTDSTFYHPTGITGWKGYICITDKLNNRVLLFQNNEKKASFVIGQHNYQSNADSTVSDSTLNQPMGVSSDSIYLYIADFGNNRILLYSGLNGKADIVIGQLNMDTNGANTTPYNLWGPTDVFSDGKGLFIADRENHRVLIYDSIPDTSGASADYVVGHLDLYDGNLLPISDSTLCYPYSVFSDGNHLFIADKYRILIYNSIPQANNAKANIIISGEGSASDSTFSGAGDLYYDGKRLFLADYGYNRVLIFSNPFLSKKASVTIGQNNWTDSLPNQNGNAGASTLYHPSGVFLRDSTLYVADTYNNRVLMFQDLNGIQEQKRTNNIFGTNSFFLKSHSNIKIQLYDITGRIVERVFAGQLSRGYHPIPTIKNHPSGVYFLQIQGKNLSICKKIILIR